MYCDRETLNLASMEGGHTKKPLSFLRGVLLIFCSGDSYSGSTRMLLRDKELHLYSMCLTASED